MSIKSILIVDDHKVVRLGLKSYLFGNNNYSVAGEAENADQAIELTRKLKPDLVLMDVVLPGLSGIEATRLIKKLYPDTDVLILTSNNDQETIIKSVEAGADGFLSKDAERDEFLKAVDTISEGEKYFGKSSVEIVNAYLKNPDDFLNLKTCLSVRETEIIALFCEGLSFKEIGEKTFTSPRTVETHKKNILKKLDLKTTVDLVKYALKNGIVHL